MLDIFENIKTFVFDVDGVLTDSTVYLLDNGEQVRRMNIKDGYALQLAIRKGYKILIISGGTSAAVEQRLRKLGIEEVIMGAHDKAAILTSYIEQNQLKRQEVLFMGDDIPDYHAMKSIGMACAPSDAVPEIKSIARYISVFAGGMGCVRDVIEKVMKINGHWDLDTQTASK